MRLRFWLKRPEDRLPDAEAILRDTPFECAWFPNRLDDGFAPLPTKEEAIATVAEATTICAREYVNHQILRIELVGNEKVTVIV